jgi:hypothetical protein
MVLINQRWMQAGAQDAQLASAARSFRGLGYYPTAHAGHLTLRALSFINNFSDSINIRSRLRQKWQSLILSVTCSSIHDHILSSHCTSRPLNIPCIMAKAVAARDQIVKLIVGAGQASPSPPVGPALGSKGVKSMDFCKVRLLSE